MSEAAASQDPAYGTQTPAYPQESTSGISASNISIHQAYPPQPNPAPAYSSYPAQAQQAQGYPPQQDYPPQAAAYGYPQQQAYPQQAYPQQAYPQQQQQVYYSPQPVVNYPAAVSVPVVLTAAPVANTTSTNSTQPPVSSRNGIIFLIATEFLALLIWIGCIVGFASALTEFDASNGGGTSAILLHWNQYFVGNSAAISYTSTAAGSTLPKCDSGGKAFLAFMILTFLLIMPFMVLVFLRFLGKSFESSTIVELIMTSTIFIFLMSAIIAWGTCVQQAKDVLSNVGGVTTSDPIELGYGYVIFCFVVASVGLIILSFLAHKNRAYQQ